MFLSALELGILLISLSNDTLNWSIFIMLIIAERLALTIRQSVRNPKHQLFDFSRWLIYYKSKFSYFILLYLTLLTELTLVSVFPRQSSLIPERVLLHIRYTGMCRWIGTLNIAHLRPEISRLNYFFAHYIRKEMESI